jgi:hypothetical protein
VALRPRFVINGNLSKELAALVDSFQQHLHLPDPAPLYAVIGTIVANALPGAPVWMMLVGPPSCGGTELIWPVRKLRSRQWNVVHCEKITGEPALLSAVPQRLHSRRATGGLMRQIGTFGILLIKDFTSVLVRKDEKRKELMGCFRDVYDGHWTRQVGGEGGYGIPWTGKMGFLTKCTPKIDTHHSVNSSMGERFVFYRFASTRGEAEGLRALRNDNPEQMQQALADAMEEFFDGIDCERVPLLTAAEERKIVAMGIITSRGRTHIERDWQRPDDVVQPPQVEAPGRVTKQLGQLYRGLKHIELPVDDRWRVVSRVAVDSMPLVRRRAVVTLSELGNGQRLGLKNLTRVTGVSERVTARTMENLVLLGVVEASMGKGNKYWYGMDEGLLGKWRTAFPDGVRSALMEEI